MAIQQVDLVGDSRPVVTPAATAQMSQMVRDGTISILDIMDRVSARSKAKEELELVTAQQGIEEATNPELIQAKRSQQLLAGDQAQQTRELLPLARRATEEKLNADIRSGQIARYGLKEKLEALNNVGFAPAPDPDKGITPEFALEVNKKFGTMLRWQKKKADAIFNSALFDAGEIVTPEGATIRGPMDKVTGAPADPKQISQWRKDAAMTLPEFLLAEPGEVVAPVAPPAVVISPVVAAQQRAQLSNQGVPNDASLTDLQVSELIRPAQPAQQSQPTGVPPGFVQTKPAPAVVPLRPTEGQQRALLAVPRFQEANAALQDLQARGYDPTSWKSWVDSYLPQVAKSGDRKEFETARSVWSQGLLRLESGAAITPKEQNWYDVAFFPVINDPPLVIQQKEALRKSVEAMVAELGAAGPIGDDLKARAQGVYRAAETFTRGANPKSQSAGGAPPAMTAPVLRTFIEAEQQPSGKVFKDGNGQWRRRL